MRCAPALVLLLAVALAGTTATAAARPTSLPCRWNWSLTDGLPPGKVLAGFDVDCSGYGSGTLVLTARLFRFDARHGRWLVAGATARRWSNLATRRGVEVLRPCATTVFRAEFHAVLHRSDGAVVGSVSVHSGRLRVAVPCVLALGSGPPQPPGTGK